MPLDYEALKVATTPAYGRARVEAPSRVTEWFFNEAVVAATELQRQGVPINPETIHGLNRRLPVFQVGELMATRAWRTAMVERGIQDASEALSPRQVAAMAIYMDMSVGLTHAQKLKRANVTQAQWNGWMRQPQFAQYMTDLSQESLQASVPVARQRIAEGVDKGDKGFIELALKMTGNDPNVQVDMRALMLRIFAILDEHIADPAVLAKIGAQVGALVQGGAGQELQRSMVTLSASAESSYPVTEAAPKQGSGFLISED